MSERVRIHWTKDGEPDSMVLTGTMDEIREQASEEIQRRRPDPNSWWSETLTPAPTVKP